jgi:type II secretory pathway component GspD/PulD (secretin)
LIVRGSAQDLQTATNLVAMLDQPDDKPLPRVENFRAFKLKYADAQEVTAILHTLDVKALIAPAPKAKVLIVSGPESSMKEIAEIIEAVDVEGASTKKDEKDTFRKP